MQPLEIEVVRSEALRIKWFDGTESRIPLTVLRRACPCASCRSERAPIPEGGLPVVPSAAEQRRMATVASAELVGQYALRITWADGHDTGIYDYELLRSLGQTQAT